MQERLQEILEKEHLTPARFAELIGVQRSSVSHILSGRNNPSLDFLQKVLVHLAHINPDWLVSGQGPYKRSQVQSTNQPAANQASSKANANTGRIEFPDKSTGKDPVKDEDRAPYFRKKQAQSIPKQQAIPNNPEKPITSKNTPFGNAHASGADMENHSKPPEKATSQEKKIVKTVFFYDDQTFEVFYPSS